ncbi:MAG: acyltransferase [Bacteroidales bacterium]|nr:acyltransferase [Bacteroidales bacterium]
MASDTPLASKPRYEILDGLRGVAAMLVVAFHLFETYSPGPTEQIINHGYLAVDFFFALSGYVIGYAYDDRFTKMGTWGFFKRRIIRLHPMVIIGTLIGAAMFYFGDAPEFDLVSQTAVSSLLFVTLMGCLMLPLTPAMDIRGWQEVNPLNGAAWSLMWEYLANILYALFIRRLSRRWLTAFVGVSALLTIDVAMNFDTWGLLKAREYAAFTLIGGFGLSADQLYIGLSRLLFPFFAGLLLSRLGWKINLRGGFWWCSLIVAAVLVMPCVGKEEFGWVNGLYCTVAVLAVFPLVLVVGAGSRTTDAATTGWCKWLGAISYPLYITHYPWIYLQMKWAADHQSLPLSTHVTVGVSIFLLVIAIAWASLKLYDEPVRAWLTAHWRRKSVAVANAGAAV